MTAHERGVLAREKSAPLASALAERGGLCCPGAARSRQEQEMIDHTGLLVSDPKKSRSFYDTALAPLGYQMMREIPTQFTGGVVVLGYGVPPKPDFWVAEGKPNEPRVHIAFRADSRKQVDDFYAAALAAGGK